MTLRAVQFSPKYCAEAEAALKDDRKALYSMDTSHDLSVIDSEGKRHRIGTFQHAGWAEEVGKMIEKHGLFGLS